MPVMDAAPPAAAPSRVVVKVGTSSITDATGRLDDGRMRAIADGVAALEAATGATPVLVSSGAGAAGRERLGLVGPLTLPAKQAAAAVGQTLLMARWDAAFPERPVAQLLLSADDVRDRTRYVNAKHALQASLDAGAVPIVNENDSVATSELKLGDNDTLSAWVAYLAGADALLVLTDVDGLYDADPRHHPNARVVPVVDDLDAAEAAVGPSAGRHGTGGMATKLRAARIARDAGIATRILGGGGAALASVARGATPGTWVAPAATAPGARKAWIAQQPARGRVLVDAGAARALGEGRSLLPRGVTGAEGAFAFGDAVDVVAPDGATVARGLVNYDAASVAAAAGRHSRDLADVLGAHDFDEIVHRDNLVVLDARPAPAGRPPTDTR